MAATTTINCSASSIVSGGGGGGGGVVVAVPPGSGSSPFLSYPCPRSPPKYPDMTGKHRELVKVQKLEREIGFLEEELKSVENLQPASRSCKEVDSYVGANPDPLIPVNRKSRRSCRFWRWLCGKSCLNLSWICCCSCGCSLRCTPKNCTLCPQKGKKSCCSGCCPSCSGSCCRPSCCCGDCSCFGKSSCSKSCCTLPTCKSCTNCCSCFKCTSCSCFKCPSMKSCRCFSCKKIC
ncbi:hypothetical protein MKW94_004129 [Papaver nudicaule]|uniref:G protein gamma domain-containing protein n=1 Tax=Papaver nudicaule TaxID=74823 RepID=A0AA41SN77_PAPNU|nr:hypothetical protein [Papaver nudicaule]